MKGTVYRQYLKNFSNNNLTV